VESKESWRNLDQVFLIFTWLSSKTIKPLFAGNDPAVSNVIGRGSGYRILDVLPVLPHAAKQPKEPTLTLGSTLLRTKQERELRSVACVTTFQAVQKVSSFRRLALQKQAGQGLGS
jgi:hypothetical protein